jgi:hypothetical protein
MVCIERILVSNDYGSAIQRGVADLESGATVAKLRIRLWKGLMRGAWPQSNIALDLGVIVVIDVEFWMEAWLRVLRSNSFITVGSDIRSLVADNMCLGKTINTAFTLVDCQSYSLSPIGSLCPAKSLTVMGERRELWDSEFFEFRS